MKRNAKNSFYKIYNKNTSINDIYIYIYISNMYIMYNDSF